MGSGNEIIVSFHSLPTGKSFRTPKSIMIFGYSITKFPFPSNGKVLSDFMDKRRGSNEYIRFPFPSTGKVLSDAKAPPKTTALLSFNSLPTGKSFRTYHDKIIDLLIEFPFPSNGKVLSDVVIRAAMDRKTVNVSIPFKRESPFGLQEIPHRLWTSFASFHSLPTGKSFRTFIQ